MRRYLVALAATAFLACGGDGGGTTEPDAAHVGTYSLRTVNGAAMPFLVATAGTTDSLHLTGGRITLNANGSFTDATDWREKISGTVATETETSLGTYTRAGALITFSMTSPQPGSYEMSFSGNTLTQRIDNTFTLVYQR